MNRLKTYCLALFFALLSILPASAKTATSTSKGFTVTTTDNVTRNGKTGIHFKIAMHVPGPEPAGAYLLVTFCNTQGDIIYTNNQQLGTYGSITLPYKDNGFDNCELFISYDELRKGKIMPTSPFKYFFTVNAKTSDNYFHQIKQSGLFEWNSTSSTTKHQQKKTSTPKPATQPSQPKSTSNKNNSNRQSSAKTSASTSNNTRRKTATFYLSVGFGNPLYGGGQWVGEGRYAKKFVVSYDNNTLTYDNTTVPVLKGKVFTYTETSKDGFRFYTYKNGMSKYTIGISSDGKDLRSIWYSGNEYSSAEYATSDRNKQQAEIAKFRAGAHPVKIIDVNNNGGGGSSNTTIPSGKRRCPGCGGTGHQKERINQTDPHAAAGKNAQYYCERCDGWFATKHNHYTPTCGVCHGKGYVD